jgi:hypothetical protein
MTIVLACTGLHANGSDETCLFSAATGLLFLLVLLFFLLQVAHLPSQLVKLLSLRSGFCSPLTWRHCCNRYKSYNGSPYRKLPPHHWFCKHFWLYLMKALEHRAWCCKLLISCRLSRLIAIISGLEKILCPVPFL